MIKPWKPTRSNSWPPEENSSRRDCPRSSRTLLRNQSRTLPLPWAITLRGLGNRFWPALYAGGFTERLFSPFEERELLNSGLELQTWCREQRARRSSGKPEILKAGSNWLRKSAVINPQSGHTRCWRLPHSLQIGQKLSRPQQETIGNTTLWVLPNPSGLNANYQSQDLARLFRE